MSGRRLSVLVCLLLAATASLDAYLKLGTRVPDGSLVTLHWSAFPIRYFVTNRDVPGVSAPQLQQAVDRAFSTWAAVPNVSIACSARRRSRPTR